jgi:peptidoglycan/LPS O-acetylase OafA/YrhL
VNVHSNRIPSLDGLRAISIGLVLIHHLAGTQYSFIPTGFANAVGLGELGVAPIIEAAAEIG